VPQTVVAKGDPSILGPDAVLFKLPTNPTQCKEMLKKMMSGGLSRAEMEKSLAFRGTSFNKA
jgi:DNA repair ATPase RecN